MSPLSITSDIERMRIFSGITSDGRPCNVSEKYVSLTANLFTADVTWTALGVKPGLPATDH